MATTKEVWKPLTGTNSTYEISSKGKIRSWVKRGPFKATLAEKPHEIKTYFQGSCECVNIPMEGKMRVRSLSKLLRTEFPDLKISKKSPVSKTEATEEPPKKTRKASKKEAKATKQPIVKVSADARQDLKRTLKQLEHLAQNVSSLMKHLGV